MSGSDFDKYVNDYRDIINKVSSISGEQFEFFIQFRLRLMKDRISKTPSLSNTIKILDFGCGTGATERYLKEFFPEAGIFAIDSSAESIRTAKAMHLDGVTFVHSDEINVPFPDEYFDVIYSNGTFHHIESAQHETFAKELSRVCRIGGNIFIFENNPRNPLMMGAMRKNPFDAGATAIYPERLHEIIMTADLSRKEICYYFFFPKFLRCFRFMEKWLCKIPFGAQYFLWAVK